MHADMVYQFTNAIVTGTHNLSKFMPKHCPHLLERKMLPANELGMTRGPLTCFPFLPDKGINRVAHPALFLVPCVPTLQKLHLSLGLFLGFALAMSL